MVRSALRKTRISAEVVKTKKALLGTQGSKETYMLLQWPCVISLADPCLIVAGDYSEGVVRYSLLFSKICGRESIYLF